MISDGHILIESIVAVIEEMQACREEKQEAIKVQRELEALAAIKF